MLGTFGAYKYKPAAFIVLAKSPGGKQGCSCADMLFLSFFCTLQLRFSVMWSHHAHNFCVFLCARDSLFGQRVSSGIDRLLLSSLIDN